MGLDTSFTEILGIARIWHYKRGLYSSYLLLGIILYFLYEEIDIEKNKIIWAFIAYILLCLLTWLVWKFTTNRWILRNGYDLILGIILEVEDNPENKDLVFVYKNIKKYSQSIIKDLNVKVIYYPVNAISHESMEAFIKNQRSQVDGFLRFSAICGNANNDYKIQISKIRLYSGIPNNYKLYDRNIDLRNQIAIQSFTREMKIVKSTSFDDKKILTDHLESVINHYIGIWFVIKNDHEKALIFLERNIPKINLTDYSIQSRINNKEKSVLSDFNLVDLVCRLYLITSDKHIYENPQKALEILIKYEKLGIESSFSVSIYTRIAKMHYECGSIEQAIEYTDKIVAIEPEFYAIYFNRVFFGILQNDLPLLTWNLKQIFHKRNSIHFEVGIIEFLQKEINKHPQKELMISLVLNFYQTLFTDKNIGKANLRNLVGKIANTGETKELKNLINRVL